MNGVFEINKKYKLRATGDWLERTIANGVLCQALKAIMSCDIGSDSSVFMSSLIFRPTKLDDMGNVIKMIVHYGLKEEIITIDNVYEASRKSPIGRAGLMYRLGSLLKRGERFMFEEIRMLKETHKEEQPRQTQNKPSKNKHNQRHSKPNRSMVQLLERGEKIVNRLKALGAEQKKLYRELEQVKLELTRVKDSVESEIDRMLSNREVKRED